MMWAHFRDDEEHSFLVNLGKNDVSIVDFIYKLQERLHCSIPDPRDYGDVEWHKYYGANNPKLSKDSIKQILKEDPHDDGSIVFFWDKYSLYVDYLSRISRTDGLYGITVLGTIERPGHLPEFYIDMSRFIYDLAKLYNAIYVRSFSVYSLDFDLFEKEAETRKLSKFFNMQVFRNDCVEEGAWDTIPFPDESLLIKIGNYSLFLSGYIHHLRSWLEFAEEQKGIKIITFREEEDE